MLIFLLKGLRPERYRERVEVRGMLGRIDLNLLPDDLIVRLAAGEDPASVLAGVLEQAAEHFPKLGAGKEDAVAVAAGDE